MSRWISYQIDKRAIIVIAHVPLKAVSNAVYMGGLAKASAILNYKVPISFHEKNPKAFLRRVIKELKLPKETIGLLTAANIENASVKSAVLRGVNLIAFATVGLSHPVAAGDHVDTQAHFSTVNTILVSDCRMSTSCLIDAYKTVVEAKAVAFRELNIRSVFSGEVATGTMTDVHVVACTNRGRTISYAGTGTKIGEYIGKLTRESIKEAALREQNSSITTPS